MVSHEIYLQLSRIAGGDVKKIEIVLNESVCRKGKREVGCSVEVGNVLSVPDFTRPCACSPRAKEAAAGAPMPTSVLCHLLPRQNWGHFRLSPFCPRFALRLLAPRKRGRRRSADANFGPLSFVA